MKMLRSTLFVVSALVGLSLTGCSISLAEDVTPPPDYQPTAVVGQPSNVPAALPLVPPDPLDGQAIYTEKCLPCHGTTGMGDGPQAANLPNIPAAIGSADFARASRPVDWFTIVGQGNLQKFMPGFAGSLNDRQRWDVVSYVYTLSMPQQEVDRGKVVYQEQCQSCHGEKGKGDGPQAVSITNGGMHDWTDPSRLAQLSGQDLHDVTAKGTDKGMPAFQGKLDDAQLWAAVSYIRSITFANTGSSGGSAAAVTPAATTPQPGTGAAETPAAAGTPQGSAVAVAGNTSISGAVVNGSGGKLPTDLKVNLLGFDQTNQVVNLTANVQPDGSFRFDKVETTAERVFMATVVYNGNTFNSDILKAADITPGTPGQIAVHVFDTSTDASALTADRMHVFFDFSKPGVVQVGELFIISNPTNHMVVAAKPGDPVLKFDLPQGSTNLTFQDGQLGGRYVQTAAGFGDTQGVQPGSGSAQILFAYDLPYDGKLDVALPIPMPVQAAVIIGPDSGVQLQSDQLQDAGQKSMQGVNVHLFTANALKAGETLPIHLSGQLGQSSGLDQNTLGGLLIGVGALVLAIGIVTYWYLRRRQSLVGVGAGEADAPAEPDSMETLLDAIVALDDLYQTGKIPKDAYDQRRAELKGKLRQMHQAKES
jgi:mono/diheme cytochrome c family protein